MSQNIDNRIVKMGFDNQRFEKNAQQTLKTLDNLDKGLKLENAVKGFGDLSSASKNVKLNHIAQAADNVSGRISAMSIAGITAVANLTNSVVNKAKRMASALTIDPVKSGLQEYETKMNAITTILTNTKSKGTTLDDVNAALADLNEYADLTIYNFAEMTRNIGTFTAAGIDLETSTKAIKGIANLAAGSGSSAQQASTAMYQLSQALAAGSLKLMDWNSVVNAGMGGELFQNALKETAKEMGIFVDESVPFRESLQSGWISADVLTKTLEGFSTNQDLVDAATKVKTLTQLFDVMQESVQSGWSVSWEEIVGDRDQAITMLTAISDGFNAIVGPSAEARNEALKYWNEMGGRDAILKSLSNAFNSLMTIVNSFNDGFRRFFPRVTGERLVEFSRNLEKLTEKFKIGDDTARKLTTIFKGFFAILDIGRLVLFKVLGGFGNLLGMFSGSNLGILDFMEKIGAFFVGLNIYIKETGALDDIFSTIGTAVMVFASAVGSALITLYEIMKKFGPIAQIFKDAIASLWGILASKAGDIQERLGSIFGRFTNIDLSGLETFVAKMKTRLEPLSNVGEKLSSVFDNIAKYITIASDKLSAAGIWMGKVLTSIKTKLSETFTGKNDIDFKKLFQAGVITGIVALLGRFIKFIYDILSAGSSFKKSILDVLDTVKDTIASYQTSIKANTILKIAGAIGILTLSLIALSLIDPEKLGASLVVMGIMFAELFGATGIFTKISKNGTITSLAGSIAMVIGMSVAMTILAGAAKKLSAINPNQLLGTTLAMGGMIAAMTAMIAVLSKMDNKSLIGTSIAMILFAVAISKLAGVMLDLSAVPWPQLAKGFTSLAVTLGLLVAFLKVSDVGKFGLSAGLGMTAMAKGVIILGDAVKIFGEMDLGVLKQGMAALSGLLLVLGVFTKLSSNASNMIVTGVGLIVVSKAMLMFIDTIEAYARLKIGTVVKGMLLLGGALTVLGLALRTFPTSAIAKAVALIVVAKALDVIAGVIERISDIDGDGIKKSLLTITAVLGILLASTYALAPVIPIFIGMSISLLAIAAAVALVGLGVRVLAAGLLTLGTIGAVGIAGISASFAALLGLIPLAAAAFAQGIKTFVASLAENLPVFLDTAKKFLLGFLQLIVDITPNIVLAFVNILYKLFDILIEYTPQLMEKGHIFMMAFLDSVAEKVPDVVERGIDIALAFIAGITEKLPEVIDAAFKFVISFIDGLAIALEENSEALINAFIRLGQALLDALILVVTEGVPAIGTAFSTLWNKGVEILEEFIPTFVQGVKDLIAAAVEAIGELDDKFKEAAGDAVSGLVDGLADGVKDVANGAKNLSESAFSAVTGFFDIHSPSKLMKWVGKMVDKGLEDGINDGKSDVVDASEDLGEESFLAMKQEEHAAKSKENGKAIGNNYAEGINQSKPNAVKAAKGLYEETKAWIEDRQFYNAITLEEELAAWQKVQKAYLEGTEERIDADRKVYKLQKDIKRAEYDHSLSWIDDMKYYGKLNLTQELAAWERVRARYYSDDKEAKKADREIYRLKKAIIEKKEALDTEYYDKSKAINDKLIEDIERVNKEYDDALDQRAQSIYSSYSLFESVGKVDKRSGVELIGNLQDQVFALENWDSALSQLAAKGLAGELIDELEDLGPSALAEVEALNRLSGPELDKYEELWKDKHRVARERATDELVQLNIDTKLKIQELNKTADAELEAIKTTWETSLAELRGVSNEEFTELKNDWDKQLVELKESATDKFSSMKTDIQNLDWSSLGINIIQGIKEGVDTEADSLISKIKDTALASLIAAKEALDINSPSRKFIEVGKFMMQGLGIGVDKNANTVNDSLENAAKNQLSFIDKLLARITQLASDEFSVRPVVTPILDLGQLNGSGKMLETLFSPTTLDLSAATTQSLEAIQMKDIINQNGIMSMLGAQTLMNTKALNDMKRVLENIKDGLDRPNIQNIFDIDNSAFDGAETIEDIARVFLNMQIANERGE